MAAIYNYEDGTEICTGLQGSSMCDIAIDAAKEHAQIHDEPVYLEDDDGEWVVYPDGHREPGTWQNEEDED